MRLLSRLRRTSLDRGDPRPFLLPGAPGADVGVLLVHGFTGTPFEMRLLGEDLSRRGLPCAAPLLAGHGAGPQALAATAWPDWVRSAEAALLDLHERVAASGRRPRLAVIGLSMGGLITLELCRRHPALIAAIGLLATPLWLRPWQVRAIRALTSSPLGHLSLPKFIGSDVSDPEMWAKNPAIAGLPLSALGSLCAFMEHVRAGVPEVRQPALLAYAVHDHTVPYGCLAELQARLGTPTNALRVLSLPRSYHLLTLDIEREVLFDALARHLHLHLLTERP
jgi:carboxylesterase